MAWKWPGGWVGWLPGWLPGWFFSWLVVGRVLTTSFAHFTAGLIFVFDNVASKGCGKKREGSRKEGRQVVLQVGNVMGCVLVGKGNVVEIKCTATKWGKTPFRTPLQIPPGQLVKV